MVLDEVIPDPASLTRAVSLDAMDHITLKIGRVGGLSKACIMRHVTVELGIRLTIEDTWGGDRGFRRFPIRSILHERLDPETHRGL
jgi:hypothetical protein